MNDRRSTKPTGYLQWLRLEFLAWLCLCADAIIVYWAPQAWDTGKIFRGFVLLVLISGILAIVLCWLRNQKRWYVMRQPSWLYRGTHVICLLCCIGLLFWLATLSLPLFFVWNTGYLLLEEEKRHWKERHRRS